MTSPRFALRLAKEDFKFSVAHFTVFSPAVAEDLHGHNYRAAVEIAGDRLDSLGLLMELGGVKEEIRRLCTELDSKTILPEHCALVRVEREGAAIEVRYGSRRYRLPAEGVSILPIRNTSIEELALYFWRRLAPSLAGTAARTLSVEIEETAGQSCVYTAEVGSAE